jgi:hypothetical protein
MSTTAAPIAIKNSDDPETARQRHDAAARKSRLGWANVLSHATRLGGAEGTLRERHRGHARPRLVTRLRPIPSSCAAFVPGASWPCPRFPPCRSMVKRWSTDACRRLRFGIAGAAYSTASAGCQLRQLRIPPQEGRRKLLPSPGNPRNASVERPAHGGNPRSFPLRPESAMTGLSRRRSRVRVPSLP